MNHTTNYNLNQWEAQDKVRRVDFNADNAKIDAALTQKAEQSTVAALSQTVAAHTAALTGKGNCRIASGTYTGTGTYGPDNPRTLSFPFTPKVIFIQNAAGAADSIDGKSGRGLLSLTLVRPVAVYYSDYMILTARFTWLDQGISWYSDSNAEAAMNLTGVTYTYVALG